MLSSLHCVTLHIIHSLLIASGITSSTCHSSHTAIIAIISYAFSVSVRTRIHLLQYTLPFVFISNVSFPTLTTLKTSTHYLHHFPHFQHSLVHASFSNTLHIDNIALPDTTFPTHRLQHSLHIHLYFLHTSLPTQLNRLIISIISLHAQFLPSLPLAALVIPSYSPSSFSFKASFPPFTSESFIF